MSSSEIIKLTLINFRAFEKKELTFEKGKLTLISGQSGVGKTTILMGIMFALGEDYRDLVKHGKRLCKVILEMDGIRITRQKGPVRLIVEKAGEVYENKEAEAVIKRAFPNIKVGYVSQQAHKYFISLPPSAQLEYLEKIATDREYVKVINENCKSLINERKIELIKATQEEETLTKQLNDLGIRKPKNINCTTDVTKEEVVAENILLRQTQNKYQRAQLENSRRIKLETDISNIGQIDETITELENKIKTLTEQNFQWRKYSQALSKKKNITKPNASQDDIEKMLKDIICIKMLEQDVERHRDLKLKLQKVTTQLDKLKLPEINVEFSETLCYKLKTYEKLLDQKNKEKKYNDDIKRLRESIPQNVYFHDQLDRIKRKRDVLDEKKDALIRLEQLKNIKQKRTIAYVCPCCNEKIGLWKGELIKLGENSGCAEPININPITAKEAEKYEREMAALDIKSEGLEDAERDVEIDINVDIQKERQILLKNERETEKINLKIIKLTDRIGTLNTSGFDELDKDMGNVYTPELLKCLEDYKDKLDEINSLKSKKTQLQEQIINLEDKVEQYNAIEKPKYTQAELQQMKKSAEAYEYLEKQCVELLCSEPEEDVDTYKRLLISITERDQKLKELEDINITPERVEELVTELEENKQRLEEMEADLKTKEACDSWRKVRKAVNRRKTLEASHPRAVRLQNLIKEAETKALESVIEQLNFYTQMFVDRFIDNLIVEFSFKTNNKINVQVVQNGHKTNITSLSGGEYARVALAITLAMAELHDVELLMLDESIASLDQETTTAVVESVRENFNGTILCIAHQTVKGMFDKVIEI